MIYIWVKLTKYNHQHTHTHTHTHTKQQSARTWYWNLDGKHFNMKRKIIGKLDKSSICHWFKNELIRL